MNGSLQRLIAGARGVADASVLRIEPLLTSRYALAPGNADDVTSYETHTETVTPRANSVPDVAASAHPAIPVRGPTLSRNGAVSHAEGPDVNAPADSAHVSFAALDSCTEQPTQQTLPRIPAKKKEPIPIDRPVESSMTTPAQSPAGMTRFINERPAPDRLGARHDTPTLEDSGPSITISIGRVDVHGAAAPAPARTPERRPAFRPDVSLDAFLRRGGSDDR